MKVEKVDLIINEMTTGGNSLNQLPSSETLNTNYPIKQHKEVGFATEITIRDSS